MKYLIKLKDYSKSALRRTVGGDGRELSSHFCNKATDRQNRSANIDRNKILTYNA